ncbi:NIPSNAP family protein [Rossellomorea vietnamensis]|uniref:NIPSNAP family protein n=1 Tax=Rossellomorea vietnamensis TaxID=218284 RepID=UPI001653AE46|nr:NIPSNAP family protein [Rossellomorea vietnamensis]
MIYRVKTYKISEKNLELFNEFFIQYLFPNQIKNGSSLIGRWVNSSKNKVTAIWAYENYNHYEEIERKIRQTKMHKEAKKRKKELPKLFISSSQEFWEMTGDYKEKERNSSETVDI